MSGCVSSRFLFARCTHPVWLASRRPGVRDDRLLVPVRRVPRRGTYTTNVETISIEYAALRNAGIAHRAERTVHFINGVDVSFLHSKAPVASPLDFLRQPHPLERKEVAIS